jgi:2-polyprenyl-3-methyl-5-hydroxy-6-metoxy-1,4-benzoquinol methylase
MAQLTPEDIQKTTDTINYHLKCIETHLPLLREVQVSLNNTRRLNDQQLLAELKEIKQDIQMLTEALQQRGVIPAGHLYESNWQAVHDLLNSDDWPLAVPEDAIVRNAQQEEIRAQNIVNLVMAEYFENMTFLDYGCGHGQVAAFVARSAKLSVGYDIDKTWTCKPSAKLFFTDNIQEVKQHTYDIILLYDVLDYCDDPVAVLTTIKQLAHTGTRIHIRTHPWCSRHGGNYYLKTNKAFVHLVLDALELQKIGIQSSSPPKHLLDPLESYRTFFAQAGLTIVSETPVITPVEDFFFSTPIIRKRIKNLWDDPVNIQEIMSVDFVDYLVQTSQNGLAIF